MKEAGKEILVAVAKSVASAVAGYYALKGVKAFDKIQAEKAQNKEAEEL